MVHFGQLPDDPNTNLSYDIALVDFDGDGIPDLVLPDLNGGTVNVFLGRGDRYFCFGRVQSVRCRLSSPIRWPSPISMATDRLI